MRTRFLVLLSFIVVLTASACATQGSTRSATFLSRSIPYETTTDGLHNAIQFVPKGAYITDINQRSAFAPGTWVRALPDTSLWPQNDNPPSVFTARVTERGKNSARLEILTYSDGMRPSYGLTAVPYSIEAAQSGENRIALPIHAITKRLLFSQHTTETTAIVPQPGLNNLRGNEGYAAVDLGNTTTRLGAAIQAVMRVTSYNDEEAVLTAWKGHVPAQAGFVLLDAWTPPGYKVQIRLHTRADALKPLIEKYLKDTLAASYIEIVSNHKEDAQTALGGVQKDSLLIYADFRDQKYIVEDQMLRVGINLWSFAGLQKDAELAALDIATRALIMAGDHLSAIWLFEQTLRESQHPIDTFAAIAPALASQYHAIERDDWSLEIALEARAYLSKTNDISQKAALHLVMGAIAAEIDRVEEFKDSFKALTSERNIMSACDNTMRFHVLALAALSASEYVSDAHAAWHKLEAEHTQTALDRQLRCFALYPAEEDACDSGKTTDTPFDLVFYPIIPRIRQSATDEAELSQLLTAIDEVGAPFIAQLLWLHLAHQARSPETAEAFLLNAAQYAHRSQNHLAEVAIMDEVRRSRAMRGYFPKNHDFESAIKRWQSLDSRSHLAALCYDYATQSAQTSEERNTLLKLAYELYLSIGDATNAATCKAAIHD